MQQNLPVYYIPHGGGPWPFVELGVDPEETSALAAYLSALIEQLPQRPKNLLVISAHWERPVPTLMTDPNPALYYDYYGFPPESYEIKWPAPGSPVLAKRVRDLLEQSGFSVAEDADRGFDHGTFIPLKLSVPEADIPTIQLSLIKGLDPAQHIKLGEALQHLRQEGVLIVASGMSFHDLHGFFNTYGATASKPFDKWLQQTAVESSEQRNAGLIAWENAPSARQAHPREEHLLPLMVAAGAAGADSGIIDYSGTYGGARISAVRFGS